MRVTDEDVALFKDAFGDHFTASEWNYLAPEFRLLVDGIVEREVKRMLRGMLDEMETVVALTDEGLKIRDWGEG